MADGAELPGQTDASSLRRGNLRYFPVAPGRLEFAAEVRRALLQERPAVVAVELPGWLRDAYLKAIRRLPELTVLVYPEERDQDQAVYLVVEPADPFTEAVRTALEIGSEVVFAEPDAYERPHLPGAYPDSYSVRHIGAGRYIESYRLYPQPRTEESAEHASGIAWKLQGTDPGAAVFVVVSLNLLEGVLEAMQEPQPEPPRRRGRTVDLLNPHPACLAEITFEYPFLQERYERFRERLEPEELADRRKSQWVLLKEAEVAYEANTGEKVAHWQRRMMARYSRNLAGISNQLVSDLYDLTLAARSVVDDNYAWEVWDLANRYAWQQEHSTLETVNLSGEEVFLNTRKLRLRRRLPRPKQRLMPRGLKRRKKEKHPGEWAEQVDGNSICSYPPEDLVIEDYGRFLKQKAKSMVSEERVRVEPFSTSILDGIDMRETIRHWYEKTIYVRKFERLAGDVGAVVVVFDEDQRDQYQYLTTWLGEHQNESDMAFYATFPFDHMVGPGIGRAEYGGFLLTLPPRRMYDVWGDPDYSFAETKAERLLLAGMDYSVERHVVYVAAKPPRTIFRSIAAHLGRSILYVPIGSLSPAKLKRIRVVHVLDGHARRESARDYIW
jgi:hypothetical protein